MNSITSPIGGLTIKHDAALESLEQAIEIYDELFIDVAPIKLYNDPNFGQNTKLKARQLTDTQCQALKVMSGCLMSVRSELRTRRDSDSQSKILLDSQHGGKDAKILAMSRQINLLKEYLVNELNRSETAEQKLKDKEDELVVVIAEREKLKKKLVSYGNGVPISTADNSCSSSSSTAPAKVFTKVKIEGGTGTQHDRGDSDPANHLGSFIRKAFGNSYFFGLVAAYDEQNSYFQIVYEDSDFEDVTYAEMRRFHWPNPIPASRRDNCLKHAKTLKILTEDQCRAMREAGSGGGSDSSGGGGQGRSSKPSAAAGDSSRIRESASSGSSSSGGMIGDSRGSERTGQSSGGDSAASAVDLSGLSTAAASVPAVSAGLAAAMVSDASYNGSADEQENSRDSLQGEAATMLTNSSSSSSASAATTMSASSAGAAVAPLASNDTVLPKGLSAASAAVLASTTTTTKLKKSSPEPTPAAAPAGTGIAGGAKIPSMFQHVVPSNSSSKGQSNSVVTLVGSKLLELKQMVQTPMPALSTVSQSSKVLPPAKSQLRQTKQVSASQLSCVSADATSEPVAVPPKAAAVPAVPPQQHALSAHVQANRSAAVAIEADTASSDSSVLFIGTRAHPGAQITTAAGSPLRGGGGGGGRGMASTGAAVVAKKKVNSNRSSSDSLHRVAIVPSPESPAKRKAEEALRSPQRGNDNDETASGRRKKHAGEPTPSK